jgi:uncharacterized protein
VTDGAGVLGADLVEALDAKLADFERRTSNQVLVWIAPRVPEETTAEELGADVIRAWGVGQKGKDNGVVFLVFTEQRRTRIATGYGMEGALPDARAKKILAEVVRPHLAEGDFGAAVEGGVDAILEAAASEGLAGTGQTVAEQQGEPPWVNLVAWASVLAVLALAAWRRSLGILGVGAALGVAGVVGLVRGFTPMAAGTPSVVLALMAPLALFGSIVRALQRRGIPLTFASRGRTIFREGDEEWSSPSEGSGVPGGSSSDFSGGGGDSGGGGASDDAGGGSKDG